jgi:hypothetical protein
MVSIRLKWPQVAKSRSDLEENTMYDPNKILAWIVANVQGMRLSRCKTLAAIVSAALLMKGVGVSHWEGPCRAKLPQNIA